MKVYQVDAFTQTLFKGNPAAVIVLDEWLSMELMQSIATENNLSETAFVKEIDDQNYEIRWFSPIAEVDFCGHATLASAFVLFNVLKRCHTVQFHTNTLGVFVVTQDEDGRIKMNFPIRRVQQVQEYPEELRRGLSKPFKAVYRNEQAYIVQYKSVQDVLDETPDLNVLKKLGNIRTAITSSHFDVAITAEDGTQFDCVSRYFAPFVGINEDPVTGSIHTGIAPLWGEILGKKDILAYQASSRGGTLYCSVLDDDRIQISGYACLYMIGEIMI